MLNEQFTWLTPFSQQEPPGLTWRNRGGTENTEFLNRNPCDLD